MKHFIILTEGDYDDFQIVQLYGCDHPIGKQEWSDVMDKFNKLMQVEQEAIYARHGGRYGYEHIPAAHNECIAFMHANHPLEAFVEKHGLVKLDHTEIWTWGKP